MMKTVKLNEEQSGKLEELLAAQDKNRAAAAKARDAERSYKELRDAFVPQCGKDDLVIFTTGDGRRVKFERKVSHLRARPASESVRWDVAPIK